MYRHRPRGISRQKDQDELEKVKEERFDYAFFIALGIFALFFLIVFIPVIGPILTLTFVPYFAGYQSGKYVNKNNGILVAIIVAVLWSIIEILIFFLILLNLNLAISSPGIYTGTDWFIILILFSANLVFCTVGTIFSPREFDVIESTAI